MAWKCSIQAPLTTSTLMQRIKVPALLMSPGGGGCQLMYYLAALLIDVALPAAPEQGLAACRLELSLNRISNFKFAENCSMPDVWGSLAMTGSRYEVA